MQVATQQQQDKSAISYHLTQKWSEVVQAQESVTDAQQDALYARFQFGKAIYNELESNDDLTQKDLADAGGWTQERVSSHKRFALYCKERYGQYNPPVAGYVADCLDNDWKLTWSLALGRIRDSKSDSSDSDTDPEARRHVETVERLMDKLDDAAEKAAEYYMDHDLPDDLRRDMDGVLTRAQQMIEDEDLSQYEVDERLEWEDYRRWVERDACCICGVHDDTITAHHIERRGTGIKADDTLVVPLCHDHHRELHKQPEGEWWEQWNVNCYEIALDKLTTFIKLLKRYE